jgi:hypothetical protein
MPDTYLVIGRVIPERKGCKHQALPFDIKYPRFGIDACIISQVEDGQLTARIIGDVGHLSNFTLKGMVMQAEQSWLNANAFIDGETFQVDIVSIIKDAKGRADGSAEIHYQDNVHDLIQSRQCQVDVDNVWNLCRWNRPLQRALNDLRMALTYVEDGPFYCYRALETIRRDIGGKDHPDNNEAQWDQMWRILGGDRAEKDFFEKLAIDIRHGEDVSYPGSQWRKATLSTWDIVERYMLHLLRERR